MKEGLERWDSGGREMKGFYNSPGQDDDLDWGVNDGDHLERHWYLAVPRLILIPETPL